MTQIAFRNIFSSGKSAINLFHIRWQWGNTMTVKDIHFRESRKYSFLQQTFCSTLKGVSAEHYRIQKCFQWSYVWILKINFLVKSQSCFVGISEVCVCPSRIMLSPFSLRSFLGGVCVWVTNCYYFCSDDIESSWSHLVWAMQICNLLCFCEGKTVWKILDQRTAHMMEWP